MSILLLALSYNWLGALVFLIRKQELNAQVERRILIGASIFLGVVVALSVSFSIAYGIYASENDFNVVYGWSRVRVTCNVSKFGFEVFFSGRTNLAAKSAHLFAHCFERCKLDIDGCVFLFFSLHFCVLHSWFRAGKETPNVKR